MKPVLTKVIDFKPDMKSLNARVKVVSISEPRQVVTARGPRTLCEALVGDETACVIMTLWENQINKVKPGDVLDIENGFISLVRGSMRLNVGKYGRITVVQAPDFPEVNQEVNVSDQIFRRPRKPRDRRPYRRF